MARLPSAQYHYLYIKIIIFTSRFLAHQRKPAIIGTANAALKPFSLKHTEFDILATLLRTGAMTTALARIERMLLNERLSGTSDKRQKSARLTNRGKKLVYAASKVRFALASEQLAGLKTQARKQLVSALQLLCLETDPSMNGRSV